MNRFLLKRHSVRRQSRLVNSNRVESSFHTTIYLKGIDHEQRFNCDSHGLAVRADRQTAEPDQARASKWQRRTSRSGVLRRIHPEILGVVGRYSSEVSLVTASSSEIKARRIFFKTSGALSELACSIAIKQSASLISSFWRGVSLSLISSRLSGCALRRGEFFGNELRPDQPPVVGPKVAAGYFSGCGQLDSWAALDREFALSITPKTDSLWRNVKYPGHRRRATNNRKRFCKRCHANNSTLVELAFQQLSLFCFSTSV